MEVEDFLGNLSLLSLMNECILSDDASNQGCINQSILKIQLAGNTSRVLHNGCLCCICMFICLFVCLIRLCFSCWLPFKIAFLKALLLREFEFPGKDKSISLQVVCFPKSLAITEVH